MQRLEAIVINTTCAEIESNIFGIFISQFTSMRCKDIDCIININNKNHTPIINTINSLANIFSRVEVCYLNINPKDDVYIKFNSGKQLDYIPKYGYISGPNIMFFHAMRKTRKYNTILLLECDCLLKQSFITDLNMFTRFSGGFLIAGSNYSGIKAGNPLTIQGTHINGVALYHTGSDIFQSLIDDLDAYIEKESKNTPYLPFDTALQQMVLSNINTDPQKWLAILRNIIRTNYIMNLSTNNDIDVEYDTEYYKSASVLHIKFNNIKRHFPQGFLIQRKEQ